MNLSRLRAGFLTCIPIKEIEWTSEITTECMQQNVVAATIRDEVLRDRPLPNNYAMGFMKTFMSKIEEFGGEIYDVTFEAYGDILTLPSSGITYKHYSVKDKAISLQETGSLVAEGTTGLQTWQASQYLAEFLIDNSSLLENKNVLELGSGLGFLGLAICSACHCRSYALSDHHPSVLRKLQANVVTNTDSMLCVPTVVDIDWEDVAQQGFPSSVQKQIEQVDIVLAAEVIYDSRIIPSFVSTLKQILEVTQASGHVYIASTIRNEETYDLFLEELGKHDLCRETITSSSPSLFIYDKKTPIAILCINQSTKDST